MKLSEMSANAYGKVTGLKGDMRFLNRIASVGMNEGAAFRVIKNDRKMPVLVYVRETLLALNRKDCERIDVMEGKA